MFKFICNSLAITAFILLSTTAGAAPHQFPEADLSKLGSIPQIKTPLYIMEYHIWYKSPFGQDAPDGYVHWDMIHDRINQPFGPDWMRDKATVGYPLLGLYHSEDRNIIQWQLQCMKNIGADGTFVQMFPEWHQGKDFDRTYIWDHIIDLAEKMNYKIGMHDEVQFRRGKPSQKWDVMGKRIGEFIEKYGNRSSFLKINNQPAVAFQFWDKFNNTMSVDELQKMIQLAQKISGQDIYWIIHAAPNESLYAIAEVDAFIPMANTNAFLNKVSGYSQNPRMDWEMMNKQLALASKFKKKYPKRDIGLWVYGGFDESPRVLSDNRTKMGWMQRDQGKTLINTLKRYEQEKPAFHMLTSWNDWQENTAIEPGWQNDSLDGDPYFYCKLIAKMKGTTFTPPPLPAKASVDPWMWQTLYGIDKTPPQIVQSRYMPMSPAIVATATDTGSPIAWLKIAEHGDLYVDASDHNTPIFHGIKSINPGRTIEGGFPLSVKAPITLTLNPAMIRQTKADMIYIALEYADTTDGIITVHYPNAHHLVNYKPNDQNGFVVRAGIKLTNQGKQAVAVRPMLGFLKDQDQVTVQIRLTAARKMPAPSPITVSRIHVFTDLTDAISGRRIDAGKTNSQVQTYTVQINSLKTSPLQKAAYIIAQDAAGNRNMPVPYHGNQSHPLMNHR